MLFSAQDSGLVLGSLASLAVTGALTAGTLGVTGTSTFTGQLGAGTIVATGPVSGTVLTASSSVNAATVTASGAISGTVLTASSSVNAATLRVTGTSVLSTTTITTAHATNTGLTIQNTTAPGKALGILNSAGSSWILYASDAGLETGHNTYLGGTLSVTGTSIFTGAMTSSGGAAFKAPVTMNTVSSASQLLAATYGSTASPTIPQTSPILSTSAGISPIKPSVVSLLTEVVGTGGHITAMCGFTEVLNSYFGGLPTAVAGDHHFGGVFVCRALGTDMRRYNSTTLLSEAVENSITGILANAEATDGARDVTVKGANIQARNTNSTTGTSLYGIELNLQHNTGTGTVDRFGMAIGSVAVGGAVGAPTGSNAGIGLVSKSSLSAVWQDGFLLYGSYPALNSSGSIIRDASNSPMKYLADVSGSSFGVADAGLFNLPSNVTSTAVGVGGAGAAPPANPEGYIKMRVNSSNVLVPFYRT